MHLQFPFDYARRRSELYQNLPEVERASTAALICNAPDIRYLTGATEGASWLAITKEGGFLLTRHMLVNETKAEIGDFEFLLPSKRSTDPVRADEFALSQLAERKIKQVVVDPTKMSASAYASLEERCARSGLLLHDAPSMVNQLRQLKDDSERKLISCCIEIAEQAFTGLIENGKSGLIGRTERDIALELEARMVELGADRQGFPQSGIIVAADANSASNHHSPGQTVVKQGSALLIDWGAELGGYRSDMTRTLFLGSVPSYAENAYPIVLQALEKAALQLREGGRMGLVDETAREVVLAAGYPEFHYGVGHGVGLEIHENPWLRAQSDELLQAGMITTVEPGIYLWGEGGIRIEGMFEITAEGFNRLDSLPTSLDEMVLQ